jgi:hypothetical protein
MHFPSIFVAALTALAVPTVVALNATETTLQYILENERLYVAVNKTNGQMAKVVLDDQDMLGYGGKGPYVNCHCTPGGVSGVLEARLCVSSSFCRAMIQRELGIVASS